MSRKISVKKTTAPSKSAEQSELDAKLEKYATKYSVEFADLKTAHTNVKAAILKKKPDADNPDNRAFIQVISQLREGQLVDTEPVSFILLGLSVLDDDKDWQLKEVGKHVATEVPKIYNDLTKNGVMKIGFPKYKAAGTGEIKSIDIEITVWHPEKFDEAVKDKGEANLHMLEAKISGQTVYIPTLATDMQKIFPRKKTENPNYKKPVLHQFKRKYVGIGVRHNEDSETGVAGQTHAPTIISTYGATAQSVLPMGVHLDWNVKVSEINNEEKEFEHYVFAVPENSKAAAVYDPGVASPNMVAETVPADDFDTVNLIQGIADWFQVEEDGKVVYSVDVAVPDILSLFQDKKPWQEMIKQNIPKLFTGLFQVRGRSQGAMYADVMSGGLLDAEDEETDIGKISTIQFKGCADNPDAEALRKGDLIKAIFSLTEDYYYDRELKKKTKDLEPIVNLLGWGWERRAGSNVISGDEVSP